MTKKEHSEYVLSANSSREDIVETFRKLRDDAILKAYQHAYTHVCRGCDFHYDNDGTDRAAALYYEGKRDLLERLIWLLSGTAEEELGRVSTVGILL